MSDVKKIDKEPIEILSWNQYNFCILDEQKAMNNLSYFVTNIKRLNVDAIIKQPQTLLMEENEIEEVGIEVANLNTDTHEVPLVRIMLRWLELTEEFFTYQDEKEGQEDLTTAHYFNSIQTLTNETEED